MIPKSAAKLGPYEITSVSIVIDAADSHATTKKESPTTPV